MSALVQQLAKLSTAEDFLKYFGVPYEQIRVEYDKTSCA